jgi:mRNA interferase RelE/StbE
LNYKLVYTRRSVKDISNLDPKTKRRIGKTLLRYKEDPIRYSEKLIEAKIGGYRFRIGEYRVISDIEGEDIVILRVGHRRDIYRKL